ncbi:hypothetical protein M9H77_36237 [Catharanthus roseus]|uniref:Uncharacterized protein n=1 Tax=Catharanthus roseus TaxID=4058 RepID=A0ACB9ZTF3_CATRO|nr:hypothetical protein M9H77_36237 [Catharanthus roseus]
MILPLSSIFGLVGGLKVPLGASSFFGHGLNFWSWNFFKMSRHASSSKTASSTTIRRWMKFFIKIWRLVELGCPRAIEWSIAPWDSSIETTMRTNLPLLIRELVTSLLISLISSLRDCNSCIMSLKGSSCWELLDYSPKGVGA